MCGARSFLRGATSEIIVSRTKLTPDHNFRMWIGMLGILKFAISTDLSTSVIFEDVFKSSESMIFSLLVFSEESNNHQTALEEHGHSFSWIYHQMEKKCIIYFLWVRWILTKSWILFPWFFRSFRGSDIE